MAPMLSLESLTSKCGTPCMEARSTFSMAIPTSAWRMMRRLEPAILSAASLTDRRRLGGDNFLVDVDFPGRISQGASIANTGNIPARPAGTFTNTTVDLVLQNLRDTPDNINDYVPFNVNKLVGGF